MKRLLAARLVLGLSSTAAGLVSSVALADSATGDECPANSGYYCSDTTPVCCYVHGEWGCYRALSDCVE